MGGLAIWASDEDLDATVDDQEDAIAGFAFGDDDVAHFHWRERGRGGAVGDDMGDEERGAGALAAEADAEMAGVLEFRSLVLQGLGQTSERKVRWEALSSPRSMPTIRSKVAESGAWAACSSYFASMAPQSRSFMGSS